MLVARLLRIGCLALVFLQPLVRRGAGYTATAGYTFEQIFGDDLGESDLSLVHAFNTCGTRKGCTNVARRKSTGEFKVRDGDSSDWPLEDVAAIWVKRSQPRFQNVAFKQDTKGYIEFIPPALAVDGSRDNKYTSCFYTNTVDIRPWWRVGFGAPVLVHSVTITNAGVDYSGLASLFKGVDIRIGYQDESRVNPLCRQNISIATPTTVDFECEREMTGTFLFVEKEEKQLYLCEVEVYGIFI